jgi:hypothetical protein
MISFHFENSTFQNATLQHFRSAFVVTLLMCSLLMVLGFVLFLYMLTSLSSLVHSRRLSSISSPSLSSPLTKGANRVAMKRIYVIVESPAKARTLSKFLPSNYIVDSCVGHIRDLAKKSTMPSHLSKKYVIPELNLRFAASQNYPPFFSFYHLIVLLMLVLM